MKIIVRNRANLDDKTPPEMWGEVFYDIEESINQFTEQITEQIAVAKNQGPWSCEKSYTRLERSEDGLAVTFDIADEGGDRRATFSTTVEEFLQTTDDLRDDPDEWLEDLETLKNAIQKRIDLLKIEMQETHYPLNQ